MSFATVIDVRNALTPGGSSSDATTAASLEDSQLVDAIAEADGVIRMMLFQRYDLSDPAASEEIQQGEPPAPVTVAVAPIRFWSRDIAAYLATLTFKRNKDVPEDEPVRLRYSQAMALLLEVKKGVIDLDLPEATTPTPDDLYVVNLYEGTMFGPDDFLLTTLPHPWSSDYIWPVV